MMKYAIKNQFNQTEMPGNEAQIVQGETRSRKMTMQFRKQFKNQLQAGYMQSNEPQIMGGEEEKKNRIKTQSQSGKMMIKNIQNKKESPKNKSMFSEQYIHKKNIIQPRSQSGRSMVEMLGVLAIIAVLSIGGIVGFRLAMNYYQANQIAHEMNIMRTDAQIKIAQGTEKLILGEPYDPISESQLGHIQFNDAYPVDFACALADDETVELSNISCHVANAYYIELQNIPEGVCRPLAELVNGMNNIIAFNVNKNEYPETGKCEAGNRNVLNAVFSAEAVSELKVCTEDTDCESENAPYCDPSRHVCVRCYEDSQCEHNQYCENNTCVTCESGVWNGEDCVECTADDDCTDTPDTPVCYTAEYKCVECLTYEHCAGKEGTPQCDEASHTCKSCIDIDLSKPVWADTQCVECVTSADCENPTTPYCNPTNNRCEPCENDSQCDTTQKERCKTSTGECVVCEDGAEWDEETKECMSCTERECTDNDDCCKDYFCEKGFSGDHSTSHSNPTGTCEPLGEVKSISLNGKSLYGSDKFLVWWDGCRWCEALHGQSGNQCDNNAYESNYMVGVEEIDWQCSGLGNLTGSQRAVYCCYADGATDIDGTPRVPSYHNELVCDASKEKSSTIKELKTLYSDQDVYIWLKNSSHVTGYAEFECILFANLYQGIIANVGARYDDKSANRARTICK